MDMHELCDRLTAEERLYQSLEYQTPGAVERWSGGAVERWSGGAVERWSGGSALVLGDGNIPVEAPCEIGRINSEAPVALQPGLR
ncbi:hypothetical protein V5E97_22570 [Singulisphaera sp. Ch08]|uniref:Uncharacterized protein n=1 Tax=Singulisphaera sp. Ch08 TaxID=3120278 RepID=A0AAU7C6W8_9BACT